MARSIAGLFPDRAGAEGAVVALREQGFDPAHMGMIIPESGRPVESEPGAHRQRGLRSTEGAVAGSAVGGTTGALLIATGALLIPGVGPVISAGVLATLVGGAAGWLVGGLAGLGFSEVEARRYEEELRKGRVLLTVDPQGREEEAWAILIRHGAESITPGTDTI